MEVSDVPAEFVRLVSLERAAGMSGPRIRARYAVGLALWAPIPPAEQSEFMRSILAAIEATRPADEPRQWEAS